MTILSRLFGGRGKPRVENIVAKRLAAMLAIMDTAREDKDELLERLLDLPTGVLNGKPRRFCTDQRTWYRFGQADQAPGLIPAVSRIISDAGSQEDFLLAASIAKQFETLCGVMPQPEGLDLDTFNYDGHLGCIIAAWEDAPIESDRRLVCKGCGQVYDFKGSAGMVTDEYCESSILGAGIDILKHASRTDHPAPDLVSPEAGCKETRGVPQYVLAGLRAGRYRRWICIVCRRVHGYPGSFFM